MTAPNVIFAWPIRGGWEMQSGNWDCICDGMEPDQVSYTRTDAVLSDPRVLALVEAAKELQSDMLERAECGMDVISGEQYRVVNAGNGAWFGFCAAIAAWEASRA